MTGATQNIYCGLQEFEDMAFVLHFIRQGDAFVDIGANVGAYTVLAAETGACCTAFEPVPATFAALAQNVRLNEFAIEPKLHNKAVGSETGEVMFSTAHDAMNHALARGEQDPSAIRVPTVTLDSFALEPLMLKIDVEGFETEVLAGARGTLASPSLLAVLMELNGAGARYGRSDDDLFATMTAAGFRPYAYDPFRRDLQARDTYDKGGNTLFLREPDAVEQRVKSAPVQVINGVSL